MFLLDEVDNEEKKIGNIMKKYTFELIVEEGNDEFWEELAGKTGCDEVRNELMSVLNGAGFHVGHNCSLELVKYENN